MLATEVKCCKNCMNLIECPRNNRHNDIDHFCMATGYFTHGIDKDITKVKRYSPGGKELVCQYRPKNERN